MSGDVHVRICERLGVRLPRATRRNVYVGSRAAGERVMAAIREFLEKKLKLKVNADKSAVARPWRKVLGYSMTWHQQPKRKIAEPSRQRFADKVRKALKSGRSQNLKRVIEEINPLLRGWGVLLPAHRSQRGVGRTRSMD